MASEVDFLAVDLVVKEHLPIADSIVVAVDAHEKPEVIELLEHVLFEVCVVDVQDLVLDSLVFDIQHEEGVLSHLVVSTQDSYGNVEG